jgi:tetratricopeptide (TPR) repeat protein
MTLATTAYTLLLGLLAAFSLKEARDQADRALREMNREARLQTAKLKKEFLEFQHQVEEQIPSLYGMQKSIGELLARISREIDSTKNWMEAEPYNKLQEETRQKILLGELTVASFDYFRIASVGSQKSQAAQIFARLANFYSARARQNPAAYNQGDLERALIYIDRACELDPRNHGHFAQRAAVILTSGDQEGTPVTPADLTRARTDLERSLKIKPRYPAALYNLAWVVDEQGEPSHAAELLTEFINEREKLPPSFRGQRLIMAYINRACANVRVLAGNRSLKDKLLKEILEDCRAACREGSDYNQKNEFTRILEENSTNDKELNLLRTLAPKDLEALLKADCSVPADPVPPVDTTAPVGS